MPAVSIIIPTHNRAKYAVHAIQCALAISEDVEVVVSDTSFHDAISPTFAMRADFGRVKLIRPGRALSVVDNFNLALSAATGDYLVFIGDDDFVSSDIMNIAAWASEEKIDAVKFSFPAQYYWPDFVHRSRGGEYAGSLRIANFSGAVSLFDPREKLFEAAADFGAGVLDMPRAYAGMISKRLKEKILLKYGDLFGGVSPDIYSAALISLVAERCVKVDFPVIVPGSSGMSTSGQSASGAHRGGLRDNSHIGAFENLQWDDRIPEFYSVPTVWAYSLLKAVERIDGGLERVDFARLYMKCLIYQRQFNAFTLHSMSIYAGLKGWRRLAFRLLRAGLSEAAWIVTKLGARVKERYFFGKVKISCRLSDTAAAQRELQDYIIKSGVKLNLPCTKRI